MSTALDKTIVSLDMGSASRAFDFLGRCGGRVGRVKVGLELFLAEGRPILERLVAEFGVRIFLDLKLHDIPNTVVGAIRSLEGAPVEFLTIHLSGGVAMVEGALRAQEKYLPWTKILGVSVLTSLEVDESEYIFWEVGMSMGLSGFIVPAPSLLSFCQKERNSGYNLLKVTPGIRFPGEGAGDQKRTACPGEALDKGANFLVIGRSLTGRGVDLEARLQQLGQIQN